MNILAQPRTITDPFAPNPSIRLGQIGLLATVGVAEAPVIPCPRVGVMSTGDELVEPGENISGGFIRDSNRCDSFLKTSSTTHTPFTLVVLP